jgi:hypothetical protein
LLPFCFDAKAECTAETIGLCTPGITTETSLSETTETIITNIDSGDLLDGSNGFVTTTKEGDMDSDWGGKGSASMPTGSYCNELGTDRCAEITSSTLTTFYQEIDISSLDITNGGRTNYTIKVDKQDSQDNIYMKINGNNGNEQVFTGTDILSETGITSGYQLYTGGFDFGGVLNTLTVEIGGQDINLSVGVLFDDVSINILYNVVNTIVTQHIQSIEEFLTLDYDQDINDVAEIVFENNEVNNDTEMFSFEPKAEPMQEFTIETIEMELNFETFDAAPEIEMANLETEMEMEMELPEIKEEIKPEIEVKQEPIKEPGETAPEEDKEKEIKVEEKKEEEVKEQPKKIENKKQEAANKILDKMGDKGKYETNNQIKTLMIMQVLGDNKSFFIQKELPEIQGFFNNQTIPGGEMIDNNILMYSLFMNNDISHSQLVNSQWQN